MIEATQEYRQGENHVRRFLEDRTVREEDNRTSNAFIWEAYDYWCRKSRVTPVGRKTFTLALESEGLIQKKDYGRYWPGIRIVDVQDPYPEMSNSEVWAGSGVAYCAKDPLN